MQITVNQPGARTIRDARPMIVDGQNVYVVLGGGTASLMIAGRIVAEQAADDMTAKAAQDWAVSYLAAQVEQDAPAADEAAVAEATDPEAVYAGVVESIRDAGALLAQQADKMARTAKPGPYRHRSQLDGRTRMIPDTDPRHPLNAHKTLRQQAARLMAWDAADEQAYQRYVSDGIGDTDGHFAPLSRIGWGQTLGAKVERDETDPWAAVTVN